MTENLAEEERGDADARILHEVMAHFIEASITKNSVAANIHAQFQYSFVLKVKQDFALTPLTKNFVEEVSQENKFEVLYDEFDYLTKSLGEDVKKSSTSSKIACIKTEYFGGIGEQAAILWEQVNVIWGPSKDTKIGPINSVLKSMGIIADINCDEFSALGLQDYRSNDEIVKATLTGGK